MSSLDNAWYPSMVIVTMAESDTVLKTKELANATRRFGLRDRLYKGS